MKKVLITGSGTGFGHEVAMRLAEKGALMSAPWTKKVRDGLGTRPPSLQKSFEMKPETPVTE